MNEDAARAWLVEHFDDERFQKLGRFCDLLTVANDQQNLIAPSTVATMWSRHILDSTQLIDHAPPNRRHWVDIGSGAGLPGLVVAILSDHPMTLIEPRRLRAEFLEQCVSELGLANVTVLQAKAEAVGAFPLPVDVISARAVARLDALFASSRRFATKSTTYILPKGESAHSEVATARRSWQGVFHVEQSIVDPKSGIVVATGVTAR